MAARSKDMRPEDLLAHAPRLRRLAVQLVGEGGDADDLVQETWLRALRRPPHRDRPLWPWLARVLANRAKNRRRDDAQRMNRERVRAGDVVAPAPDEIAGELEAQRALVEAVLELDEPERTIVTLRWFRELDSNAIGAALDMPPGTVRWRHAHAIEALRRKLDARFGERAAWAALFLPSLRVAPSASAAAALTTGALVMSGAAKLGIAAVAVALLGWAWMAREPAVEAEPLAQDGTVAPPGEAHERATDRGVQEAPRTNDQPDHERVSISTAPNVDATRPPTVTEPPAPLTALVQAVILDRDGRPIPGSGLRARGPATTWADAGESDGRVELAVPWRGGEHEWTQELAATAIGYATSYTSAVLRTSRPTNLGEIRLDREAAIAGRVVDPSGLGVAGARVWLDSAPIGRGFDEEAWRRRGPDSTAAREYRLEEVRAPSTASGTDGAFRLDGVVAGGHRVWAKGEGTRYVWSDAIQLESGGAIEGVELVLERWRPEDRITGIVLTPNGEPVAGASITMAFAEPGFTHREHLSSDAQGRFEWVVRAALPHTVTAIDPRRALGEAAVEHVLPGTRDLVLQLVEPRMLRIRARNEAEEPVVAIQVGIVSEDELQTTFVMSTSMEEPGLFAVQVPALSFYVEVRAGGYRSQRDGPFDPATAPELVEFSLQPLPVIAGQVRIDGAPAVGATVELAQAFEQWNVRVGGFPSRAVLGGFETSTDEEARFEVRIELADPFYVRAERQDRAPAELGPFATAEEAARTELVLDLPVGGAIEGRVMLPDDRDGSGTIVAVNRGDGRPRTQRAGPGGSFRFDRLAPGRYAVSRRPVEFDAKQSSSYSRYAGNSGFAPNCTVVDGRTTRFDLDLRGEDR